MSKGVSKQTQTSTNKKHNNAKYKAQHITPENTYKLFLDKNMFK